MYDVVVLTERRYVNKPTDNDVYMWNVYNEDYALVRALEAEGLSVARKSWDDPSFDWNDTRYILFRSTWDYFDRLPEFLNWLESTSKQCKMINPYETVKWNMDKHYLKDLEDLGIAIPATYIIEKGDKRTLKNWMDGCGLKECVLKPCVSGAGRHTYHVKPSNIQDMKDIFHSLIENEAMMIQEFMKSVTSEGEITLVILGGKFSHAVKKLAKKGDFRVQDDFGGTVQDYSPSTEEIAMAESIMHKVTPMPSYGRVDLIKNNDGKWVLSELELIEPELWFRFSETAAAQLASHISQSITIAH